VPPLPLLDNLAHLLCRLSAGAPGDPAEAAREFVQAFSAAYGRRSPAFLPCSYREALALANRESKFLLIYLHSGSHEDTRRFCERTLCDEVVLDFLAANLLVWGGDVRSAEAHLVSSMLQSATFPHLALVHSSQGSRGPVLVASSSGACSAEELLLLLTQSLEDHGAALVASRAENEERVRRRGGVRRGSPPLSPPPRTGVQQAAASPAGRRVRGQSGTRCGAGGGEGAAGAGSRRAGGGGAGPPARRPGGVRGACRPPRGSGLLAGRRA
jgi:hypothetical protein